MEDYYPEWLKIAEKLDQLDAQKKQAMVSPDVYAEIQRLKINLFGLTVRSSPLFPYEKHWDACDIDTHQQIRIPSGEWVHGIMMPAIDFTYAEPLSLPIQMPEQGTQNNWFKGRMF
jgi:hypothetical protein